MKREIRELICIGCPLGCNLQAVVIDGAASEITGNTCPKGADYARKELTDPRRILTTTVRVQSGQLPQVPVKTLSDIPKDRIFDAMKALKGVSVEAPVALGQVIAEDIAGTGVPVVATRKIAAKK